MKSPSDSFGMVYDVLSAFFMMYYVVLYDFMMFHVVSYGCINDHYDGLCGISSQGK